MKRTVFKETKSMIRKRLLNLLRNQKEEDRVRKSRVIFDRLFALPEFQRSQTIHFYASFDGEVETFEMMRQAQKLGKKIVLPATIKNQKKIVPFIIEDLEKDLKVGSHGIKEPRGMALKSLDLNDIDLVIVPGVAFDRQYNRLGRGAGYYDRFLSQIPTDTPTIGLAFDFQLVERLPQQKKHDIPVTRIIVN